MEPLVQLDFQGQFDKSIDPTSRAKAQWVLLQDLECKYTGKIVKGFASKFEDDVWFSQSSRKKIVVNWAALYQGTRAAEQLLCKAVYFEMAATHNLTIQTFKVKRINYNNTLSELFLAKGVLTGNRGKPLIGLSFITDEDLLVMLDARLVLSPNRAVFLQECAEMAAWIGMAQHIADAVPLFEIRAQLPWTKAGMTIKGWAERRAVDLGAAFRETKGYVPLVPDSASPLIERSLNLILEQSEHLAEIASLVRGYSRDQKYDGPSAELLLQKYNPIFAHIATPPDITGLPSADSKVSPVIVWMRHLLYLARGASVNVILFTTGLRNVDIGRLKKDVCMPSGRVDMLYYLRVYIQKTMNWVVLPVPAQTNRAIALLRALKQTNNDYLLDTAKFAVNQYHIHILEEDAHISTIAVNKMLKDFAGHFNIPFIDPDSGENYTAHNYRVTVAGWLDAHSNLSLLLVRRLFGHSNDVMPTVYLRNNPSYISAREEEARRAARETARLMSLAASQGRLAGTKGEQLQAGFDIHKSRLEADPQKSHSLTDAECIISFAELIEQRIVDGSLCGFLTPFGVLCGRNPVDSSQPPCAKRSHREATRELPPEVVAHLNDVDPANCIGTSCDQAMVGPWSEPIKESLIWYAGLLRHQHDGETLDQKTFKEHAVSFIKQYGPPIKKVFHIQVLTEGTVKSESGTQL
jgi:integrase